MAEIDGRHGETGAGQHFVPVPAAVQIAVVPGPAVNIDDEGEGALPVRREQSETDPAVAEPQILHVPGGKALHLVQHVPAPLPGSCVAFERAVRPAD